MTSSQQERPGLNAFSSVRRGMTLAAIEESLGPPVRKAGPGTQVLEYLLADGSKMEILFAHPQLIKMIHYRVDGTKMTWVPS